MNDLKKCQIQVAKRCWSADLSVDEAAKQIRELCGESMPKAEICSIYKKEQAEFEKWLKVLKPE